MSGVFEEREEGGGFLTEHQREVFNAVAQEREPVKEITERPRIEHGTKHTPVFAKHHHVVNPKQERKSHAAKSGRPRRGGLGGKGAWGNPLIPYTEYDNSDPRDPNYDDGGDSYQLFGAPLAESLEGYKARVVSVLEEYFTSGDIPSATAEFTDLGSSNYHHHIVKKLVSFSLDRHDREKEMAASLLSALYVEVIEPEQMSKGFLRLLESVDDLELDCPNAADVVSLFLARAVVDDILPPSFLSKTKKNVPEGSKGTEVIHMAEAHLATPHHAERVERAWGGTGQATVAGAKAKIGELLKEYVVSGDKAEACRCIRELNMPFFHHEVVKNALTRAMEERNNGENRLFELLKETANEGLVSSSQVTKGFSRLVDLIDDLALDIPNAKDLLQAYTARATSEGWLEKSFAKTVKGLVNGEGTAEPGEAKTLQNYKHKSVEIVQEFFESGDTEEVSHSLEELAFPDLLHLFVKKLITLAMDRKHREKEMASGLLSALYPEVLPSDQIEAAFTNLLNSVEDLALDIPLAANELALFIARAVVDDILAPLFLTWAREAFKEGSLAREVVKAAQSMLEARHAGERILRCWGGGGGRTVDEAKEKIVRLLEEFQAGGELGEACQCIRDLDLPFFHHEIVKKALVMAMEKQTDRPLELLQECSNESLISTSQMVKGFSRVEEALSDLELDIPDARQRFTVYIERAKKDGWFPLKSETPVEGNGNANHEEKDEGKDEEKVEKEKVEKVEIEKVESKS